MTPPLQGVDPRFESGWAHMSPIGLSTGCLYKHLEPFSLKAIKAIQSIGVNGIELCGVKAERFIPGQTLQDLHTSDLDCFDYKSLHAPVDVVYRDNSQTRELLKEIERLNKKFNFDLVLFHPDTIEDFLLFETVKFPVGFENMDERKASMKTPKELKDKIKGKIGFVFDVTHLYTVDNTMQLADEFRKKLPRPIQIHYSGYKVDGIDSQQHYPMTLLPAPQQKILDAIPKGIPIIMESVVPQNQEYASVLREEVALLTRFLSSKQ